MSDTSVSIACLIVKVTDGSVQAIGGLFEVKIALKSKVSTFIAELKKQSEAASAIPFPLSQQGLVLSLWKLEKFLPIPPKKVVKTLLEKLALDEEDVIKDVVQITLGDLCDYFDEEPPRRHLHVLVQVPEQPQSPTDVADNRGTKPSKRQRLDDDDVAAIRAAEAPAVGEPPLVLDYWVEDKNLDWKTFYKYWSKKSFEETFRSSIIPLALDDRGYQDRSYRLERLVPSQGQILVLDVYRTLFDRVIAFQKRFFYRGVLVTGQPGTGKTTWLWFMLICLIMKGEVIVFHSIGQTRLLYDGRIYLPGMHVELPPNSIKKQTIWCLIDSDAELKAPPPYLVSNGSRFIFPIQAAPPNDVRYKIWSKERNPATFGMPLWSEEELSQGFRLHPDYTASEACRVVEAIRKYGNAPRDVYNGIFNSAGSDYGIDLALNKTTLDALVKILNQLAQTPPTWPEESFPHRLLAIDSKTYIKLDEDQHHNSKDQHDAFIPRFRSEHICRMVIDRVGYLQHQQAQQLFRVFRLLPQSSTLAGWIFESLVHDILSNADTKNRIERILFPMAHDKTKNVLQCSPSSVGPVPFSLRDRNFDSVEFLRGGSNWRPHRKDGTTLENLYFVPKRPNNLLFDSFFVDLEEEEGKYMTPVVWIFQVTTSPTHQGSKQGWPIINCIANAATKRTKEHAETFKSNHPQASEITVGNVKVKYVLVRPYPIENCSWTMPEGRPNAIVGDGFCLFVNFKELWMGH